jgi:carbamoyl-phosphate synthase small subunit
VSRFSDQPVIDLQTGKTEITAQNHSFAVDPESLDPEEVEITHINLNDRTVEGMRHRKLPVFSVQYHPEAAPGPHDSLYLFERFCRLVERLGVCVTVREKADSGVLKPGLRGSRGL